MNWLIILFWIANITNILQYIHFWHLHSSLPEVFDIVNTYRAEFSALIPLITNWLSRSVGRRNTRGASVRGVCAYTWGPWTDRTIDGKKRTHALTPDGDERVGRDNNGSSALRMSPGPRGGTDRFTGSPLRRADAAEVAHLFRHTSWFIHQSSALLHTDGSVPQQALASVCVPVCRLGQVFNGHVITSPCVCTIPRNGPREATTSNVTKTL